MGKVSGVSNKAPLPNVHVPVSKAPSDKKLNEMSTIIKKEMDELISLSFKLNKTFLKKAGVVQEAFSFKSKEIKSYQNSSKLIAKTYKVIKEIGNYCGIINKISKEEEKNEISEEPIQKQFDILDQAQKKAEKNKLAGKLFFKSLSLPVEVGSLALNIAIFFEKHLPISIDGLADYSKISGLISKSLKISEAINDLTYLIYQNNIINEQKDELKNLKANKSLPKIKIANFEKTLKKLTFKMEKTATAFKLKLTYLLPITANNVYSFMLFFKAIKKNIMISTGISGFFQLANFVSALHEFRQTSHASSSHAKHTKDLQAENTSLQAENISKILEKRKQIQENKLKDEKTEFGNLKDLENFKNQLKIRGLLPLDKEINSIEDLEQHINRLWIDDLLNSDINLSALKEKLKKADITIPDIDSITSFAAFEKIKGNIINNKLIDTAFDHLINNYIEKKGILSEGSKELLRARIKTHEEINQNFFSAKLTQSAVMFGMNTLSVIASIELLVIPLLGITFPPILLIIPTAIGAAQFFGVTALGMYHLHKYKPNLAKTLASFIKIDILLAKVSLYYANWQLSKAKQNTSNETETINYWKGQSEKYYNDIKGLEDKILKAKMADYELASKSKVFEIINEKDDFDFIVENLVKGEFWKDPKALAFVEKYGGRDLKKEFEENAVENEVKKDPKALSQKLKNYVLRSSQEIMSWMENENINEIDVSIP